MVEASRPTFDFLGRQFKEAAIFRVGARLVLLHWLKCFEGGTLGLVFRVRARRALVGLAGVKARCTFHPWVAFPG